MPKTIPGVGAGVAFSISLLAVPVQALAVECEDLKDLTDFPVPTRITLAQQEPATSTLPAHCRVRGFAQERTGARGVRYGTGFEVRLPTNWNGRFMFQGTGGTQGSVPNATGSGAGPLSPTLARGFAVASENCGHDNTQWGSQQGRVPPYPGITVGNMFFEDEQAVRDWTYGSADVTTRIAKHLIQSYYGEPVKRSYWVGCSTAGHKGMGMSQRFPEHFDGIIAGAPFFMPPMISLSESWSVQQVASVSPKDEKGNPKYWESYSVKDRELFTSAILEACDGLDGLADGVIDNPKACRFNPASFRFAATGQPLQCSGAKDDSCLSAAQVTAIRKMARGPRTSWGARVRSLDGKVVSGYPYDGGWMEPSGIPLRNIGTMTSPPGNLDLGMQQLPLFWFRTPNPGFWYIDPAANPETQPQLFNWDGDAYLVEHRAPAVNDNTNLRAFNRRGGKLIFWHGLSDSGPPWTYTADYYEKAKLRNGGDFMRLYLVPNMGHCGGGPSTDTFDFLTPLMAWVEQGVAPDSVVATGSNFKTEPKKRSRPLCPYPQTARYTGPQGGDLALAENYGCVRDPDEPRGLRSGQEDD